MKTAYTSDRIKKDDARKLLVMKLQLEAQVLEKHKYAIAQGAGADRRWFTNVYENGTDGKRHKKKMAAASYEALLQKLDAFYTTAEEADAKARTMASMYDAWLSHEFEICSRPATVKRYDECWRKYYAGTDIVNIPVCELTPEVFEDWGRALIKQNAMTAKAFGNAIIVARKLLGEAYRQNENPARLAEFPSHLFKVKARPAAETQVFYEDEIAALAETCKEKARQTGDTAWLSVPLLMQTGARLGEILGLAFEDVDVENRTLHIHRMYATEFSLDEDGKWSRQYIRREGLKRNAPDRFVHLTPAALEIIEEVKSLAGDSEYLFDICPTTLRERLYKLCDKMDGPRRGTHACRRTFISRLFDNEDISRDFIRQTVGHQSLQTTIRSYVYSSKRSAQNESAMDAVIG